MLVRVKEEQLSDNEGQVEAGKEINRAAVKQEVKNEPFEDFNGAERAQQRVYVKEEEPAEYLLIIPPKEEPESGKQATTNPTASEDREWKCDYFDCDYAGKAKYQLFRHQGTHTKPFGCKDCDKRFGTKKQLNHHRLIKHENPNAFQCKVCNKNLSNKHSLKKHLETHEENPEKPFKCLKCPKAFRSKKELKNHLQQIHSDSKPFACDLCPKKFAIPDQIREHVKIHRKEKLFKCEVCSKGFTHKYSFKIHMESHAGKRFGCDLCNSQCLTEKALRIHKINVHSKQALKCEKCDYVAKHLQHLRQHQNVHKEWTEADAVECPICKRKCRNKRALAIHIKASHSEKRFECDFLNCNYVGKTNTLLKQHRGSHDKKLKCEICEKLFNTKKHLTQHNLIKHENPDHFKCHVCDKRLSYKENLRNHLQTHEEDAAKAFSCQQCSMTFRLKNMLRNHQINIHGKLKKLYVYEFITNATNFSH